MEFTISRDELTYRTMIYTVQANSLEEAVSKIKDDDYDEVEEHDSEPTDTLHDLWVWREATDENGNKSHFQEATKSWVDGPEYPNIGIIVQS